MPSLVLVVRAYTPFTAAVPAPLTVIAVTEVSCASHAALGAGVGGGVGIGSEQELRGGQWMKTFCLNSSAW
jgi:hypothetical protein